MSAMPETKPLKVLLDERDNLPDETVVVGPDEPTRGGWVMVRRVGDQSGGWTFARARAGDATGVVRMPNHLAKKIEVKDSQDVEIRQPSRTEVRRHSPDARVYRQSVLGIWTVVVGVGVGAAALFADDGNWATWTVVGGSVAVVLLQTRSWWLHRRDLA